MTNLLRHHRRADRFAQLLDEADGARRQHVRSPYDEEMTDLLAVRHQLVSTPPAALDPEFRTGLRAMLVATAEREGIGRTATPEPAAPVRPRRPVGVFARAPRARTAMVAGVAVGAVAFAGMSSASGDAMPGDALYGLKRSSERAQLALASSDVGRAQLYLDFAETRLAEASNLSSGLDRVLADMDRDTMAGVRLLTTAASHRRDPAALDPIDRFVAGQRTALAQLAAQVTGVDLERVGGSLDLLDEIEERSAELRQDLDLGCPAATSIDVLGPLSGTCLTLPAPGTLAEPDAPGLTSPDTDQDPRQPDQRDAPESGPDTPETSPDRSTTEAGSDESDAGSATTEDEPTAPEEDEQADERGLLSTLNRLIGNLLGD